MFIVDDWILSKKTARLIAKDDEELSYEVRKLALIDHCQKNALEPNAHFFGFLFSAFELSFFLVHKNYS